MDPQALLEKVRDSMNVRRAFGDPYEKEGVTVIPVARVFGTGGGGSDANANGGGGFGLTVRPSGVFIIRGDAVSWQPSLDLNRVIFGGQIAGIFALLTIRSALKRRRRRRRSS